MRGTMVLSGWLLSIGLAYAQGAGDPVTPPPLVPPGEARRNFDQAINRTAGSRGVGQIQRIVLHTIQGPYSSAVNWFNNRDSKSSAHYLIDFDGTTLQMVLDQDQAHHVKHGHNADTIGIEHAGYAARNEWSQAQLATSARLVAELCSDYQIDPSPSTIVSHRVLDPERRSDPGRFFPWQAYIAEVRRQKRMIDILKSRGQAIPPLDISGLSATPGSGNAGGVVHDDPTINPLTGAARPLTQQDIEDAEANDPQAAGVRLGRAAPPTTSMRPVRRGEEASAQPRVAPPTSNAQ